MKRKDYIGPDGVFAGVRAKLFSVAYRMLGTRADAARAPRVVALHL